MFWCFLPPYCLLLFRYFSCCFITAAFVAKQEKKRKQSNDTSVHRIVIFNMLHRWLKCRLNSGSFFPLFRMFNASNSCYCLPSGENFVFYWIETETEASLYSAHCVRLPSSLIWLSQLCCFFSIRFIWWRWTCALDGFIFSMYAVDCINEHAPKNGWSIALLMVSVIFWGCNNGKMNETRNKCLEKSIFSHSFRWRSEQKHRKVK